MAFSDRMGIRTPKEIQIDSLDEDTRSSLWNICKIFVFRQSQYLIANDPMRYLAESLYIGFYKQPTDYIPNNCPEFIKLQLRFFLNAEWYKVLDLVEFIKEYLFRTKKDGDSFIRSINDVLEMEKSAYRFVGGVLAPLSNKDEIGEIKTAMSLTGATSPVAIHIRTALECFSKKPEADYRNCVKESISAVEAAANNLSGTKGTLGDALKKIEMHEAFRQSMLKLYGYTSDEGGIRHALSAAAKVDESDPRFMLISCSAFSNFLISKKNALGI